MSRLTDLISRAKARDSQLGADLEQEFNVLSSRLPYGLNFERHSPEVVELPLRPVRKGDKVRVLPERGSKQKGDQRLWQVKYIHKAKNTADLELLGAAFPETISAGLGDLVVVAEFRDTIYPGLVSTGKVERGGNKPFHSVINGENYHALKALTYTHRGKVDAIYIDPPYNTGAKDWKYNNDYVEGDDQYRHSKWLAMMERRLMVARELLTPQDSVLIVTIDEKEVNRLGLLLEQVFAGSRIQMVTTVTNQRGVARGQEFARVDEYAFVVFVGGVRVTQGSDDLLTSDETIAKQRIDIWNRLMRRGTDSLRADSPRQFYPIFIDPVRKAIVSAGDPLPLGANRFSVEAPMGCVAVWPIRTNGAEGRWTLGVESLRKYASEGTAKVGAYSKARDQWSISYLISKDLARIKSGEIRVTGRDQNGVLQLEHAEHIERKKLPRTVWFRDSHNAGMYGSEHLSRFIPGRKFPFPKSLYLVEDMLRVFLSEKPNGIVMDFFCGSGTTAHAVMRLNNQDGGSRQSISVTNNEVAADEQKALLAQRLRPGDELWERNGICEYITKPRVAAAITGNTPDGEPIKGDYKFTDEFPMAEGFEENAEFFTLTYEARNAVNHNLAYARIAPLLWLRAGARGKRIDKLPANGWAVVDAYALLTSVDAATSFIDAVNQANGLRVAYVVTDDDRRFQAIAKRLRNGIEPVRLYESYLTNFSFSNGD
ncbi:DNA methyltransferase [Hydrogenophaga crassostreae]|uniref:site-specific DNA-methyltransferase (adenine-specific) n=1 Tax=Hydrogenophaga crassostreae TaxID=1763535 RepID=A0A162T3B3_9BURK|nr:DNA methyltransferase [Hydrogenophaga crassostreae]AOW14530.1 site-specific DNA-methyltransferase [Hydrogenophaga crassostreae]OAD43060.1 DNA methyltransferase [Hydrogenophaga crassostreae]